MNLSYPLFTSQRSDSFPFPCLKSGGLEKKTTKPILQRMFHGEREGWKLMEQDQEIREDVE